MFGKEAEAYAVMPEAWQTAWSKAFAREAPTFSLLAIPGANTHTHTHTHTHARSCETRS